VYCINFAAFIDLLVLFFAEISWYLWDTAEERSTKFQGPVWLRMVSCQKCFQGRHAAWHCYAWRSEQ